MNTLPYEVNNKVLVKDIGRDSKFLVSSYEGYCPYYLVEAVGEDLCFTAYWEDKEDANAEPKLIMVVATWHYQDMTITELLDLIIDEYSYNRCIGLKWVAPTLEYRERYYFDSLSIGQQYKENTTNEVYSVTKIENDFVEFTNENTTLGISKCWYDHHVHYFDLDEQE